MTAAEDPAEPAPAKGIRPEELFSCYSHLAGALAALVGTVVLALAARNPTYRIIALIYGFGAVFMFSASALYHGFKRTEDSRSLLRRLDHLAIFVMIAGSYTPVCWLHLDGAWRWSILGIQWGLVLLGLVLKILFIGTPRWVTAAIYVGMGWIAVIPMHKLAASLGLHELALILGGGVAYTLGAVIYALKRPNPWPGRFGFHEIFHVGVLIGAALHYIAFYRMLT